MPSARFAANGAWLAVQVMAHNLARSARIGLGQQTVTTKTLRRRVFALAGRITRSARGLTLHLPGAGPGRSSSAAPWPDCEPFHSQPDGARTPLTHQPTQRPRKLASTVRERLLPILAISLATATVGRHRCPQKRLQTAPQPRLRSNSSPESRLVPHPLPLSSRRPSLSIGGFAPTVQAGSIHANHLTRNQPAGRQRLEASLGNPALTTVN